MNAASAREREVPAGFEPLRAPLGFVHGIGGFYVHEHLDVLVLRVTASHLNGIGIAHGGLLATLADTAFGVILKRKLELPVAPVTVNLSLDYLRPARDGEWVEAEVSAQKAGRRLINASCLLRAEDRLLLRCTGIFMQPEA